MVIENNPAVRNVINKTTTVQKKPKKICIHCGKALDLTSYYSNRDWDDQLGKDSWCKDCVGKCSTKDELREYFWENHREWNEKIWQAAQKKAESLLSTNATYQKSSDDRKQVLLERMTCQNAPGYFNAYYKYIDTTKDGKTLSYVEAKEKGEVIEDVDPNIKTWSDEWCGYFNSKEIQWLDEYYKKLSKNGELVFDTTTDDYAHKIAASSLANNKALSDFSAGKCDYSVVKDTASIFDMFNKSANFAACKKRADEDTDKGSFGELVAYLESHGRPCTRKIDWEPDEVDKTMIELQHIVRAIGLDS